MLTPTQFMIGPISLSISPASPALAHGQIKPVEQDRMALANLALIIIHRLQMPSLPRRSGAKVNP
jgi:hypothetical protein